MALHKDYNIDDALIICGKGSHASYSIIVHMQAEKQSINVVEIFFFGFSLFNWIYTWGWIVLLSSYWVAMICAFIAWGQIRVINILSLWKYVLKSWERHKERDAPINPPTVCILKKFRWRNYASFPWNIKLLWSFKKTQKNEQLIYESIYLAGFLQTLLAILIKKKNNLSRQRT